MRTWQYWTTGREIDKSIRRGMDYLAQTQQSDGSWRARWFGNANNPGGESPIYGTSQVVLAYRDLDQVENRLAKRAGMARCCRGPRRRLGRRRAGPTERRRRRSRRSTVEETAMAVEALLAAPHDPRWQAALENGLQCLVRRGGTIRLGQPATIGLYPPRLWYAEKIIHWRSRSPRWDTP